MGRSVLVVDDDAAARGIVMPLLADAGFDATEAADGIEALDRLDQRRFDLVLLDIHMPRLDGWGVLAYIATMPTRPRVIVISGGGEVVPPASLAAHVTGVLAKPFTPSAMLAACAKVLARATPGRQGDDA